MRICDAGAGTHRWLSRLTTGLVVLLAASVFAAAASASATINVTKKCYVNVNPSAGAPVTILGSGFGPGDAVDIQGGDLFTTTTASATGTIAATTHGPILTTVDPATKRFTLTATDEVNPAAVATTELKVANLAVTTKPAKVKHLTTKVTFLFSGFAPGKHIFAHYVRKKSLARAEFGKANGDCGVLKEKALLYPGGHPRYRQYTVAFDSAKKYSKHTHPQVSGTLNIGEVF